MPSNISYNNMLTQFNKEASLVKLGVPRPLEEINLIHQIQELLDLDILELLSRSCNKLTLVFTDKPLVLALVVDKVRISSAMNQTQTCQKSKYANYYNEERRAGLKGDRKDIM